MASGNMKEIKNRIKSVSSTMQITKAMELVASSKLRRAKEKSMKTAPYFEALYGTMCDIAMSNKEFTSPYTKKREIKNSLYLVIAGERGLAGGYNSNVFKLVKAETAEKNAKFVSIGKKATEFVKKYNAEGFISSHDDILDDVTFSNVDAISAHICELYKKGEIDEVSVVYTEILSPLEQAPNMLNVLPLAELKSDKEIGRLMLTEYDPGSEEVFNQIVPKYISGIIYGAVIESYASEQAARRVAMESASDNASDMIDNLSLIYNRARQDAITQEITEIVAGASKS